jgi:hypothetical protein
MDCPSERMASLVTSDAGAVPTRGAKKWWALGVALALSAVIAAGFALTYLAFTHILAKAPAASVETITEIWEGTLP